MKYLRFILPAIFIGSIVFQSCTTNPSAQKPNVVMIVVDDMNGFSTRKIYPMVKTPHIDKLCQEGINFVNAACNVPVCNPSRSSFFSGLLPHHTGAYLNGSDGWNRSDLLMEIQNIPECFKANGYTTWGRGKILHNPLDSTRENNMWDNRPIYKGGFGPFPEEEYWFGGSSFSSIKGWTEPDTDFPDVKNANAAIEFLAQEHDKPFYLYYGLWRPHTPYTAPKRFFDMYNESEMILPATYKEGDLDDVPFLGQMLVDSLNKYRNRDIPFDTLFRKFIWAYCANNSFADWNVGRVIEALDKSKYAENTIVVLFSDNGYHAGSKLRWEKATLWEQADYVPFIIRTPKTKGSVSNATVSLVDVYPTLVDYCGLTPPNHQLDGHSLVPLLNNPSMEWEHPSFTTYGVEYSSVRTEKYRYIRYPDMTEELYDMEVDPYEFENIVDLPEMQAVKEVLKKEIPANWAPSTGGRLEVPRNMEKVMRPATPFDNIKPNS